MVNMNEYTLNALSNQFKLDKKIINYVNLKEEAILDKFNAINEIKEYNQFF